MPYAEKVLSNRLLVVDGKKYRVTLIAFEIEKFFTFKLCLNACGSDTVRVLSVGRVKKKKGKIIATYFPQKAGVSDTFPHPNHEGWKVSRYRLIDVLKGPVGVPHMVSRASHRMRRKSGRRLGCNLWRRIEKMKNGGGLVANLS